MLQEKWRKWQIEYKVIVLERACVRQEWKYYHKQDLKHSFFKMYDSASHLLRKRMNQKLEGLTAVGERQC